MPDAELVRLENVSMAFPGGATDFWGRPAGPPTIALDGINLSVSVGETLAIVGESGSGKSTLARLVVALERPTSGTVFFAGKDLSTLQGAEREDYRRRVQMVFQNPFTSLNPTMTIGQLICEPWRVHGLHRDDDRHREALRLMASVGLSEAFYDRKPRQLSGGERQRVGIARALALDPDLLVCDESLSALDVSVQSQILVLLQDLQQSRRLSLVFISHDLSVVRHLAHRIAVMRRGQVVELAECDQLYERPGHPYTAALLAAATSLHSLDASFDASLDASLETDRGGAVAEGEQTSGTIDREKDRHD